MVERLVTQVVVVALEVFQLVVVLWDVPWLVPYVVVVERLVIQVVVVLLEVFQEVVVLCEVP